MLRLRFTCTTGKEKKKTITNCSVFEQKEACERPFLPTKRSMDVYNGTRQRTHTNPVYDCHTSEFSFLFIAFFLPLFSFFGFISNFDRIAWVFRSWSKKHSLHRQLPRSSKALFSPTPTLTLLKYTSRLPKPYINPRPKTFQQF